MTKKVAKKAKKRLNPDVEALAVLVGKLESRIMVLEAQKIALHKAIVAGANEVRPFFGLGSMALVLDNIAKKIRP